MSSRYGFSGVVFTNRSISVGGSTSAQYTFAIAQEAEIGSIDAVAMELHFVTHPFPMYGSAAADVALPALQPSWFVPKPSLVFDLASDGVVSLGNRTIGVGSVVEAAVNVSLPQGVATGSLISLEANASSTVHFSSVEVVRVSSAPSVASSLVPFVPSSLSVL